MRDQHQTGTPNALCGIAIMIGVAGFFGFGICLFANLANTFHW